MICICQYLFINIPIDGHFDCFQLCALTDKIAMNIHGYISGQMVSIYLTL